MTDNTCKGKRRQDGQLSEQAAVARRVAVAAPDDNLLSEIRHPKKRAYLIALAESSVLATKMGVTCHP